jgi:PAS domain-containing protein
MSTDLNQYFKSLVDQDPDPIVICDLEHRIIYMNPTAVSQFANRGGAALLGKNLLDCHPPRAVEMINKTLEWFGQSRENNIVHSSYNPAKQRDTYMIAMRSEDGSLIGYYEKHVYRTTDTTEFYKFE